MRETKSIKVLPFVHKTLKMAAIEHGKNVTDMASEAIMEGLSSMRPKKNTKSTKK